jgi:ATP-dependent exoDNAse (exonuclease V) beta subunit
MHAHVFSCLITTALLSRQAPSKSVIEMKQLYQFETDVLTRKKIEPFRTEWRIAAPEFMLAGTVDFVGKKPDGSYVLVDWKRSLKLPKNIFSSYGKAAK